MSSIQVEIQLIASIAAVACALPGVFLVLRRMALMSDAISHTVLLGIVVAFFMVGSLESPLLLVGAALMGVITVSLVELLNKTRLVGEDAAMGLVFPALFSLAIILISRYAGGVHLDADVVLLGDITTAPLVRLIIGGMDFGPRALYELLAVLLLNLAFIGLFYKELKLATFDAGLATALGFAPGLIHYGLMTMVSVTAVASFGAVGSILVVALMIAPPVTAYLLTDSLPRMLLYSATIGIASAISGYWLARWFDASVSGAMATMTGVIFMIVFLLAPERGLIALARRRARQRWEFAQTALAIHLLQHGDLPEAQEECREANLNAHLRWEPSFVRQVVQMAEKGGLVEKSGELLVLTPNGRQHASHAIAYF